MVKQPEIIETRTISGKGILIVPEDKRNWRNYTLVASVLRNPLNQYIDLNFNPPRRVLGNLTFERGGNVTRVEPVQFDPQSWDFINDGAAQNLYTLQCIYTGVLQSFENLGTALGLTVTSVENKVAEFASLELVWDTIKLVCYADTQIKLELYATDFWTCSGDQKKTDPPPAKKPTPEPKKPPGTPAEDNSPPYDGNNDDGNSSDFPGDRPPDPEPPPPGQTPGVNYTVTFTWDLLDASMNIIQTNNFSGTVRGPVVDYGTSNNLSNVSPGPASVGAYLIGTLSNGSPQYIRDGYGSAGNNFVSSPRNVVFSPNP